MKFSSNTWLTAFLLFVAAAPMSAQKTEKSNRLREVIHSHQPMLQAGFEKQLDSILYSSYEAGSWVVDDKEGYTYRTDGLIEELLDYDLAENGRTWELVEKVAFFYDSEAQLERVLGSYYNEDLEEWVKEGEQTNTYDSKGNLTETIYSFFDEDLKEWVQDEKITYSYTANGDLATEVSAYYDGAWIDSYKTEYSYSTDNYPAEVLESEYDEDNEEWVLSSKAVHTLSDKKQIERTLHYNWNPESNVWEEGFLASYSYDPNGNPKTEMFAYGKQNGEWQNTNRFGYKYDVNFKVEDVMSPPLNFFLPDQYSEIVNMYKGYVGESYNDGSWAENSKTEMFYSDAPSSVAPTVLFEELAQVRIQDQQIILSATNHVQGLQYTVVLTNGQIMHRGTLSTQGRIALQVPANGIYLIQVQTREATSTQKVMVY